MSRPQRWMVWLCAILLGVVVVAPTATFARELSSEVVVQQHLIDPAIWPAMRSTSVRSRMMASLLHKVERWPKLNAKLRNCRSSCRQGSMRKMVEMMVRSPRYTGGPKECPNGCVLRCRRLSLIHPQFHLLLMSLLQPQILGVLRQCAEALRAMPSPSTSTVGGVAHCAGR